MKTKIVLSICLFLSFSTVLISKNTHHVPQKNFSITIHVDSIIGQEKQLMYLYKLRDEGYSILDSAIVGGNKKSATLKGYTPYENEYSIIFSKRGPVNLIFIVKPNDKISVNITDADNKNAGFTIKKDIKGSPATKRYAEFWEKLNHLILKRLKYENSMSTYGISDSLRKEYKDSLNYYLAQKKKLIINTIINSKDPYIVYYQFPLSITLSTDSINLLTNRVKKEFSYYKPMGHLGVNSGYIEPNATAKEASEKIARIWKSRVMFKQEEQGTKKKTIQIGDVLNFSLNDTDGKTNSFSKYKGKYILVDFWASWCIPCVKEMPDIQYIQKEFSKELVVCAISMDKDHRTWKKAIKDFELSDLINFVATDSKGNIVGEVQHLNIGEIPQNYLLDRTGKVVAINLHGKDLMDKLHALIKQGDI